MVEQLQPDFLLTDIRMPFISGTELAKQVREVQPLIQVAFLSGYDDFTYAKEAIDHDVIAYLLKPISMKELTSALREIHAKISARFRDVYTGEDKRASLHVATAALLLDIYDDAKEERRVRELFDQLHFPVSEETRYIVLVTAFQESLSPTLSDLATINKIIRREFTCISVPSGPRIYTLVAGDGEMIQHMEVFLGEFYQASRRFLSSDVVLSVSRPFSDLSQAAKATQDAVSLQKHAEEGGLFLVRDRQDGVGLLCDRTLELIE